MYDPSESLTPASVQPPSPSARQSKQVERVLRALKSASEPTYLSRVRRYASNETREFLWRDLAIEGVAAFLWGLSQGGWSSNGFYQGFVGFLILFVVFYIVHLGHAPRALDLARAVQIDALVEDLGITKDLLIEEYLFALLNDLNLAVWRFGKVFTPHATTRARSLEAGRGT